jgi:uncharacterized iron-regulated protein
MTLDEMISAVERMQSVYDQMVKHEQKEAARHIRWAISKLAEQIWIAAL